MNDISTFLQKTGIPIPDNSTPDTPVAVKIKQILTTEFDLSPNVVVNEARLLLDLDLYDAERLDFMAAWMNAFDINNTLLDKIMHPDNKGMDIMFHVGTVGEIVALTEWLVQQTSMKTETR